MYVTVLCLNGLKGDYRNLVAGTPLNPCSSELPGMRIQTDRGSLVLKTLLVVRLTPAFKCIQVNPTREKQEMKI